MLKLVPWYTQPVIWLLPTLLGSQAALTVSGAWESEQFKAPEEWFQLEPEILTLPGETPVIWLPETEAMAELEEAKLPPVNPAGADADMPEPTGTEAADSETEPAGQAMRLKAAVALLAAFIVSVQVVLVPKEAQSPPQPANEEPALAEAVSTTLEPELKEAEQVEPQFIPAGEEDTVPWPVPDLETDNE